MIAGLAKVTFLLLLFLLFFLFFRGTLLVLIGRKIARLRLYHVRNARIGRRISGYLSKYKLLYGHLNDLLESTRYRMAPGSFLTVTSILFLLGFSGGALLFSSVKGVLTLSLILAALPYVLLRLKLVTQHMKTRIDFMPAAELFYQHYVLAPNRNIRTLVRDCLAENRIRHPIKPVFEQLHRSMSAGREIDDCLRIFSLSLGHIWADYFTSILRVGLLEGNDISLNLRELLSDMRKARLHDQAERNRLLEIRIASFSPLFFLALFLFINFKVNHDASYRFYVLDSLGRNMLLDAFILIFAAFVMGLMLSMKRM